jgi:hypothetical protein
MKHLKRLLWMLLSFFLLSCEKQDEAIVLPEPGDVLQLSAAMGSNYDEQVYVDLSTGAISAIPYRRFDLMFETDPNGKFIFLNSAKYMFAGRAVQQDFFTADTTGITWKVDAEHLQGDSTAIGNWWVGANGTAYASDVFVIDRGRVEHSGADRFRKFQVLSAGQNMYEIRYAALDNSGLSVFTVPKDTLYSLMYFSFDNNGALVQQAPPKDQWDFVFTKYTHTYFDQPLSSPFRYYPVTGVLLNKWQPVKGQVFKKDSTANYIPFEQMASPGVVNYPLSENADVIGFDWKYYDFANSSYFMRPDLYFICLDREGFYYKLRMLDFYDGSGTKGTITLQYQRL